VKFFRFHFDRYGKLLGPLYLYYLLGTQNCYIYQSLNHNWVFEQMTLFQDLSVDPFTFHQGSLSFLFFYFWHLVLFVHWIVIIGFGVEAIETLRKEYTKTTHSWLGSNQFANMNLFTLLNCANVFQSYVWTRITLLIIKCFFLAVDLYPQIYFIFFLTDQFLMSTFLIDFL